MKVKCKKCGTVQEVQVEGVALLDACQLMKAWKCIKRDCRAGSGSMMLHFETKEPKP